jgi:ankyrin repeat protein
MAVQAVKNFQYDLLPNILIDINNKRSLHELHQAKELIQQQGLDTDVRIIAYDLLQDYIFLYDNRCDVEFFRYPNTNRTNLMVILSRGYYFLHHDKYSQLTPESINRQDITGKTAIHYLIDNFNLLIFNSLLEKGADINILDNNGNSPMMDLKSRYLIAKNFLIRDNDIITFDFTRHDSAKFFDIYVYVRSINEEYNNCGYSLTTDSYGTLPYRGTKFLSDKYDKGYYKNKYDYKDLIIAAIYRNISLDLTLNQICQAIRLQTPDMSWMIEQFIYYALLPNQDRKYIDDYTDYSYLSSNSSLRTETDRYTNTPLNRIIFAANPIPNDVVVFRYFTNPLPKPVDGHPIEYLHRGQYSTSIDPIFTSKVCDKAYILRLFIPAGTHGFYVPGRESEIILSHPTKMLITNYQEKYLYCKSKKTIGLVHMYDAVYQPTTFIYH